MTKMVCAIAHFGKGGEKINPGTEADGKPDGKYWVAKTESKKLEVATPKK